MARLYRKSLKTLTSWAVDRDVWNYEAEIIRARFDAERGCSSAKAARLIKVCGVCFNVWSYGRIVWFCGCTFFHFHCVY